MIKRTSMWVNQRFAEAEARGTCLVALTSAERRCLRRAMVDGHIMEVLPGAFVRAGYWKELKPSRKMLHRMHALQEQQPNLVFAGPSAAVAYGMAVSNWYLDRVWVTTTRKAHHRKTRHIRGVIAPGADPTVVSDLRLTPLGRTVGDCLRVMDFRSGVAIADSCLRVTGKSGDQLAVMVRDCCARHAGMAQLDALLSLADVRSESGGESIARATMLELGIQPPDLQRVLQISVGQHESVRIDYAWDIGDKFIVGEFDGHEKYVNGEMTGGRGIGQILDDEHRRQSFVEASPDVLRVVRFGFRDVMHEKEFLDLLVGCGVPRTFACDDRVIAAGGVLRCR